MTTVQDYPAGNWDHRRANHTPNSYPVIVAASVTPTIVVNNAAGSAMFLEEVIGGLGPQPYVSGTPITVPGVYKLSVEAYGVAYANFGHDYVVAGADFELVPEPVTMLLLAFGGVAAIRRRR